MSYNTLFVDEVEAFFQRDDVVILDHRDPRSFAEAHLPKAQPVSDAVVMQMRKKRQAPILVYCYHGNSSKDLASFLVTLGCENVYNLHGGWAAWSHYQQHRKPNALSDTLSKWLADCGFDQENINSRIDNGMTALMQAAYLAEGSIVEELLQAGIDINLVNNDGNNALWFACVSEDLAIIKTLIDNGIEMDHCNDNGATSLIYASSAGKYSVVQALVNAGANVRVETLDGFTALDSAATLEILKFLKPQFAAA